MGDGAKPPEEVITHRWGLFHLEIPTNSLLVGLVQLPDLCMTVSVKLLSASAGTVNERSVHKQDNS